MVLYEVFSQPELIRYKTTLISKASIIQIICVVISLLSPFLIAYFTGGFWIKDKTYMETPRINFEYRYLILLQTDNNLYVTSSFENVNQIYSDQYLPATRSINEVDMDDNGVNDYLDLSMTLNGILGTEIVRSFKGLFLFNNSLMLNPNIIFESAAFVESSNALAATQIEFRGDLEFFQRQKFLDRANYYDYAYFFLDQNNPDIEQLNLGNILNSYYDRPYGSKLKTDYVSWSSPTNDGSFQIKCRVRYSPYKINYVPAFWEQFKWGWIQYVAVLLPFLFVFNLIKIFIFQNQLVPTVIMNSNQKLKTN